MTPIKPLQVNNPTFCPHNILLLPVRMLSVFGHKQTQMETLASFLWKCDRRSLQIMTSEVETVCDQIKTLASKASNSSQEIFVTFLFARVGPRSGPQQ